MIDTDRLLRRLLRFTGRLPTNIKLLYPLWLSEQLDQVEEVFVSEDLPQGLESLSIAYASDIHHGPLLNRARAVALVERLNAMEADIILLGGDYGEDCLSATQFFEQTPRLRARLGVYAAIGNHDLLGDEAMLTGLLHAMGDKGVTVLRNSAVTLTIGDHRLCLCSVDDVKEGRPDLQPILAPAAAANFTLFAPHSPDAFPLALATPGFHFDLAVAGHTHGGQLKLFGKVLHHSSKYKNRYLSGWKEERGRRMLISHGVGCSLMPLRLGARAQIHRIRLTRDN